MVLVAVLVASGLAVGYPSWARRLRRPGNRPSRAAQVPRVDALLRSLASAYGVRYVATDAWDLRYLPDRLHLTAAGHREFGDLVAAER